MNIGGNAPDDWKAQYKCFHCGLPVAEWDNGTWVHIRMGQRECTMNRAIFELPTYAVPRSHPDFASYSPIVVKNPLYTLSFYDDYGNFISQEIRVNYNG